MLKGCLFVKILLYYYFLTVSKQKFFIGVSYTIKRKITRKKLKMFTVQKGFHQKHVGEVKEIVSFNVVICSQELFAQCQRCGHLTSVRYMRNGFEVSRIECGIHHMLGPKKKFFRGNGLLTLVCPTKGYILRPFIRCNKCHKYWICHEGYFYITCKCWCRFINSRGESPVQNQ